MNDYNDERSKMLGNDPVEKVVTKLAIPAIFCLILTIIYMGFAENLAKLFITDSDVIAIASRGIRYFAIFIPVLGFIMTFNNLFQALGYATIAMILSIARQGIFLIPSIILLPKFWGLNGVLLSQTVADGLTLILTSIFAIYIIKKINSMMNKNSMLIKTE